MAVLEQKKISTALQNFPELNRRRFSRQDYRSMVDAGLFIDQRVELIEGEIIVMAPIGDAHSAMTDPFVALLGNAFGDGFTVRSQAPIALGEDRTPSEPQPDLAVVVGTWRDYVARKPYAGDVRLIVEVAESSLRIDRKMKSVLYAGANIPEYWIVNLVDDCLEVHRDPKNGGYTSVAIYKRTDLVTPLHAPNAKVKVADFMP